LQEGEKMQKIQICLLVLIFAAITGCSKDKSIAPGGNRAPAAPSNPLPGQNAIDVAITAQLTWQCSDPDGDSLNFDIYFGQQQNPPLLSESIHGNSYQPATLQANMVYYWKVAAKDSLGHTTIGPIWSFTTTAAPGGFQLRGHYNASNATTVYVDGSYAYLLNSATMMILNIANPASPIYAGAYSGTNGPKAVYVASNRAYLLGNQCVDVVNVSNPSSSSRIAIQYTPNTAYDFTVSGSAYSAVINISSIDSLRQYYLDNTYFRMDHGASYFWPGCPMWNFTWAGTFGCADGNYGYNEHDFVTFTDSIEGRLSLPGFRGNDLIVSGDYAYAALGQYGLEIISVSNKRQPQFTGAYMASDDVMGVACNGNTAFLACDSAGVVALDVTNPANPSLIDSYRTDAGAKQVFFLNNRVYVAAGSAGLYILEFLP
jgi:hypothetical protein